MPEQAWKTNPSDLPCTFTCAGWNHSLKHCWFTLFSISRTMLSGIWKTRESMNQIQWWVMQEAFSLQKSKGIQKIFFFQGRPSQLHLSLWKMNRGSMSFRSVSNDRSLVVVMRHNCSSGQWQVASVRNQRVNTGFPDPLLKMLSLQHCHQAAGTYPVTHTHKKHNLTFDYLGYTAVLLEGKPQTKQG